MHGVSEVIIHKIQFSSMKRMVARRNYVSTLFFLYLCYLYYFVELDTSMKNGCLEKLCVYSILYLSMLLISYLIYAYSILLYLCYLCYFVDISMKNGCLGKQCVGSTPSFSMEMSVLVWLIWLLSLLIGNTTYILE